MSALKTSAKWFLLALSLAFARTLAARQEEPAPRLWVWAWDRPEDLRFLKPDEAGVAFFVLGVRVEGDKVHLRPRTAPLRMQPGMRRIAVVRFTTAQASLSQGALHRVISGIRKHALVPGIEGIQLDFDATRSQRPLYAQLLTGLRRAPGIQVPLTVTALASWCMGDRWIKDLDADGAVVMLFQMGEGTAEALAWLSRERPVAGLLQGTLAWGLSTDQPLPVAPPRRAQVYLFHPRPWTPSAFRKALHMVNQ